MTTDTPEEVGTPTVQLGSEAYVNVRFRYASDSREYTTDLTMIEYCYLLNSGILDGKPLQYVELFSMDGVDMIYDFQIAKQGMQPWRIR